MKDESKKVLSKDQLKSKLDELGDEIKYRVEEAKKLYTSPLPNHKLYAFINDYVMYNLNKGIEKQVTKLTATDGFYKNEMVKILLPEELQKVDDALRKVGLSSLANK